MLCGKTAKHGGYMSDNTPRQEIDLGLNRIKRIMGLLGRPEDACPVIQIAGTNAKGSVGTFIRNILTGLGLKCGHFSSPAVFNATEVITVNGTPISAAALKKYRDEVMDAAVKCGEEPTEFEVLTAAAYLYFAGKRCDVVIAEAGLGGDLDATNITNTTICSVITPIGFDHTAILGDTLAEIASHKAGIIKPGSICVCAVQEREVLRVLGSASKENGVPFIVCDRPEHVTKCGEGFCFDNYYTGRTEVLMSAYYQTENALLAISCVYELREAGALGLDRIDPAAFNEAVREAVKKTRMPGRMEIICRKPLIIIDGGHNPPAARMLRESIDRMWPDGGFTYVFGAFADKAYMDVFNTVYEGGDVYVVSAPGPRGENATQLARTIKETTEAENVKAVSIREAARCAMSAGRTLAFGSLSWIGRFKQEVKALEDRKS